MAAASRAASEARGWHARLNGVEYRLARELQELLGYTQWRNFETVVDKARTACANAGQAVDDHFADVSKMIDLGKGAQREVVDVELTRYACYLIAQNGDPKKDAIAFAMTYFAVQTRKQEIIEARIAEWERLQAREKLTLSQKELSGVLYERGIDSQGFGRILSKGDAALFGGLSTQNIKDRLAVPEGRPLADFGTQLEEFIVVVAVTLALLLALVTLVPWLNRYLPWRWGRLHRVRAAHRAIRKAPGTATPSIERVLAMRAVTRLDYATLLGYTPDPLGDWASGRHDRLARAELASVGLRP